MPERARGIGCRERVVDDAQNRRSRFVPADDVTRPVVGQHPVGESVEDGPRDVGRTGGLGWRALGEFRRCNTVLDPNRRKTFPMANSTAVISRDAAARGRRETAE